LRDCLNIQSQGTTLVGYFDVVFNKQNVISALIMIRLWDFNNIETKQEHNQKKAWEGNKIILCNYEIYYVLIHCAISSIISRSVDESDEQSMF